MKDKAYLVYKKVNSRIEAEIQYGYHTTGTGQLKEQNELERYEIAMVK